jgi:predicted ATPase with chaperone activity
MADFHRYSDGIYGNGENYNIFQDKKEQDLDEINSIKKLKYTADRESQKIAELNQSLKSKKTIKESAVRDGVSADRLYEKTKKLPPFVADVVEEKQIEKAEKKGAIGWGYLAKRILGDSLQFDKLERINSLRD